MSKLYWQLVYLIINEDEVKVETIYQGITKRVEELYHNDKIKILHVLQIRDITHGYISCIKLRDKKKLEEYF